jgi:hypothetical protein
VRSSNADGANGNDKVKVGIIGSGNIGSDLMFKILREPGHMELALVTGIDPKYFIPDALGNPAPWHPLRGTSSPEGVAVDVDGRIYIAAVTPPGLGRYTINNNTVPAPQQGRGGAQGGQ